MRLQFCGAANMVTGSCFYLDTGHHRILVDCGMFQGRDFRAHNQGPFPFDPGSIEYVFLTHAHIDHCGRLPLLVKQGFHGAIIATRATRDLVRILLQDSAHVQEGNFKSCSRRQAEGCDEILLYSPEEAEDVMQYFQLYPYGDTVRLSEHLEFRMRDAGHILGSAIFELWAKNNHDRFKKLVFSGDLGQQGQRIVKDPDLIRDADYVIVESTYGNRTHRSKDETVRELIGIVKQAKDRDGNVLIPMFAVERAQELLYELNLIVENGIIEGGIEVYFDSPLASKATKIFEEHEYLYDEDARRLVESGDRIFEFEGLHYVGRFRESERLAARRGIVIMAGSGMCTGGRILYHLENNIEGRQNHIVFAGYQVKGTRGRDLVDGAKSIRLRGREYAVNLSVHTLGGFSAHADQHDLEYWLRGFGGTPKAVFTVHGDAEIISIFSEHIRSALQLPAYAPEMGEIVEIE